jgi:pre-mRNA-splicing factor 38B
LDEIKREVDELEPYLRGYINAPSSAFTLLYKLFTMHLTRRQLNGMIAPKSPTFHIFFSFIIFPSFPLSLSLPFRYVRGLGF